MTNMEGFEGALSPSGDEVMRTITDDANFWEMYAKSNATTTLGEHTGGHMNSRNITGSTASGAKIFLKEPDREIYYRQPLPGVWYDGPVDASSGKLIDYQKGVNITVTTPDSGDGMPTVVSLYVPNDPNAHPEIEPPHAATLEFADGSKKIIPAENPVPEDEGKFEEAVGLLKHHLGDNVTWDAPEAEEIFYPPQVRGEDPRRDIL